VRLPEYTVASASGREIGHDGDVPAKTTPPARKAPLPQELAERFIAVSRAVGKSSARSQFGALSAARYDVLHAIFHAGPMPMSHVAARLQVSPRTVTDLVDGLEADGYIVRSRHATDRRKTVLTLTEDGLEALAGARRVRLADAGSFFATLEPGERTTLAALLDKVLAAAPPRPGDAAGAARSAAVE